MSMKLLALAALAAPAAAFVAQPAGFASSAALRSGISSAARARPLHTGVSMLVSKDLKHQTPLLPAARESALAPLQSSASEPAQPKKSIDIVLIIYFGLWYLGNYYYNITNKLALQAAGGAAGFPLTIATMQLGVGCLYALFLWAAPDARSYPKITLADIKAMIPVAFCAAFAHSFSVFALSAGAVSFGQIVKAAEPAFAAVLGVTIYGKKISKGKWLCLIPIIGGVILASVKELDFAWSALITAALANVFAAFKANENAKLMTTPGISNRLENVGNQFAWTTILAFLISVPVMIAKEGSKWGAFCTLAKTNNIVMWNMVASGVWFYLYNELATMTIKKTSAVTQSVANTAKRVIVIVGVAIVLGESLAPMKLIGCAIGIGGVFLYSTIDMIIKPAKN